VLSRFELNLRNSIESNKCNKKEEKYFHGVKYIKKRTDN